MPNRVYTWAAWAMVATIAVSASADIIQLKDGRTFSGTIRRQGEVETITGEDGTQTIVKPADVEKVTLTSHTTPAEAAEAAWTRDAAAIKQANDLQTIIDLHQKFLQKYPDQPISKEVRTSLAEYMKLARQHGVKFHGRWIPAAQVDVTRQQWADRAKPALDFYRGNNLRAALNAAQAALREDAANPDALILAGLAAYRLNSLNASRDYFSTLTTTDPANVLAENNLAVILFQQHREAESLVHYTHALQAAPENRFVADNIEEALHAYSGETHIPPYMDLMRQFNQSEPRIEALMARKGMYRWGSTWVPLPILDRLNANVQQIKNAMTQLTSQYQSANANEQSLDSQIAQAEAQYNAAATNIAYLNSLIASSYGDMSSFVAERNQLMLDLQRIEARRNALLAQKQSAAGQVAAAPAQADKLKAALAAALATQFTGTQRIMDWGEADNPPPPVIVSLPSPVPVALPAPTPVPVPAPTLEETMLTSGYDQATTPIGVIPVPIPLPGSGWGHGGRGGHGGDHGHGGGGHGGEHDGGHGGDHGGHDGGHGGQGGGGGWGHGGHGGSGGSDVGTSPIPPIGSPVGPIGSPIPIITGPGQFGAPFPTPITGDNPNPGHHHHNDTPAPAPVISTPAAPAVSPPSMPQAPAMAPAAPSLPPVSSGSSAGSGSRDSSRNSGPSPGHIGP